MRKEKAMLRELFGNIAFYIGDRIHVSNRIKLLPPTYSSNSARANI